MLALEGWFEKPKNRLFGKILAFWICNKCTLSKVEVRHKLYRHYMKIKGEAVPAPLVAPFVLI
jgi:hypothetical protein